MLTTPDFGCVEPGWADSVTPWVIRDKQANCQPHTTVQDPGCPAKQQAQHRCSDNGAHPPLGSHATSAQVTLTLMSSPINPPEPCHMPPDRGDTALLHSLADWLSGPAYYSMATAVTGSTWPSEIAPVVSQLPQPVPPQHPRFSEVGRTGSSTAPGREPPYTKQSSAVFTATPAPGSTNKEATAPADVWSGRTVDVIAPLPCSQQQTPSCPQRCLSCKHRFNGCLVPWITHLYSMYTCLLVAG